MIVSSPNPMPLIDINLPRIRNRRFTAVELAHSRLAWETAGAGLDARRLPVDVRYVEELKRLDCELYMRCLDYAAGKNWDQFHCNSCASYKPAIDPEEEMQLAAFAALLRKDYGEEIG